MRAKIYARVSTQEQADKGYSIDTQLDAGRKLAAELGCFNPEIYVDEGYSGEFLDRPDLNNLRDSLRNSIYDGVVIFYDPDRLARNLAHQLIVTEEIEKAGAQLKFISVNFENSPEGKLFYSIRGAISDFEKEKIKERTMRGKRGKALKGKVISNHRILGYDLNRADCSYSVNDAEAEIVRKIYSLCTINRMGTRSIAQELNLLGYRTKNGKLFYGSAILRILSNPIYKGTKQAFRHYDKMMGQKMGPAGKAIKIKKRTLRDPSEWVEIQVPEIVSPEVWDTAQLVIQENRILSPRNSKRQYLLSGIVRCGYCGKSMIGVSYPSHGYYYQYYICNARWEDKKACSNRYVRIDELDNAVWDSIRSEALSKNELPVIQAPSDDEALYKRMVAALDALKARQAMIMKWVREGSVEDLNAADKQMQGLNKEIHLAKTTLNTLATNRSKPGPNAKAVLAAETHDQKRAILRDWGVKVYVKRDVKGDVSWAFR